MRAILTKVALLYKGWQFECGLGHKEFNVVFADSGSIGCIVSSFA